MLSLPDGIDEYLRDHSSAEDPLLAELARDTQANAKLPQMQTGHVEGLLLRLLAQLSGARRALEIGTFTGYSALSMAMGMPDDGEIITCDIDEEVTAMARRYWARSPHGSKITLKLAPALETISALAGPFDMAFIDADKENYTNYWEAVVPLVRAGGLIVVDNVLWSGNVLAPEDEPGKAVAVFNDHARQDARVQLVMLSVRDGITLAVKC